MRRNLLVAVLGVLALSSCDPSESTEPTCDNDGVLTLLAQSVPTATLVPCYRHLPVGWEFRSLDANSVGARLVLASDTRGEGSIAADIASECAPVPGAPVTSDEVGTELYRAEEEGPDRYTATWTYSFEGGCVTYQIALTSSRWERLLDAALAVSYTHLTLPTIYSV